MLLKYCSRSCVEGFATSASFLLTGRCPYRSLCPAVAVGVEPWCSNVDRAWPLMWELGLPLYIIIAATAPLMCSACVCLWKACAVQAPCPRGALSAQLSAFCIAGLPHCSPSIPTPQVNLAMALKHGCSSSCSQSFTNRAWSGFVKLLTVVCCWVVPSYCAHARAVLKPVNLLCFVQRACHLSIVLMCPITMPN